MYERPEAAEGGPIALVQDDDIIDIDIPNRRLDIRLSETELKNRKDIWKPKDPKKSGGFIDIYSKMVSGAEEGAVLHKLVP